MSQFLLVLGVLFIQAALVRSFEWGMGPSSSLEEKIKKNCYCPTPPNLVLKEVTICQDDYQHLTCGNGLIMKVYDVFYGRADNVTCPHRDRARTLDTNCKAPPAGLQSIKEACDMGRVCYPKTGHYLLSNLCPGTHKYLKILYSCFR